jgi:DNA repair photolyase
MWERNIWKEQPGKFQMYLDRIPRLISYHDTWMSIDPIHGCPYHCKYCVLRYGDKTGVRPQVIASPEETLKQLLGHPFFRSGITPLAIGNETDMLHPLNSAYLIELLSILQSEGITNSISLITKTPLHDGVLDKIRKFESLKILFYLSYSGLGKNLEPGFSDENFRTNFLRVKQHGFPIIHYWRPLLPENTTTEAIHTMLEFVSGIADASIICGLKLHPELSKIINTSRSIHIPDYYMDKHGEWLETAVLDGILAMAKQVCPDYPIYRHGSCALAYVLSRPNHTATIYQKEICLPSRCPARQRGICSSSQHVPHSDRVIALLRSMGRNSHFHYAVDSITIEDDFTQEEFIYMLHVLNYPIKVKQVDYQNIYRGSIFGDQPGLNHQTGL